ncbi:uncharacterized protein LOC109489013 isoform X4 [Ailuropoda melanoleuca]|uniref:uncharacterized protein LOC109489013 isoform X4 n=1 Tax=Ailuropoda melanoleuca TaxID=9646 RepID=UPI001493F4C5|nr:uncharacterized protein LOC109489013 isoform X4 [Ailuropoda melanoleuca]
MERPPTAVPADSPRKGLSINHQASRSLYSSEAERHRRAPAAGCFLNYGCGAIAGAGQASPSRVHSLAGTGRGDSIEPTVQRAPGERQPAWWLRERLVGDHRSNASERPPWFSRGTNMEAQNGGPTPRALEGWEFSGTANHPANCRFKSWTAIGGNETSE